jgi:T5orf172 domain
MTIKEPTRIFTELPEDSFGVLVKNDIDEKKLLWLVNEIGEEKLRKSALKRNKYYPDSLLFVSVILKRFNLKVPPHVYREVNVPVYWVYILVLNDLSAVKIGITGNLLERVRSYVKTANYNQNFDEELIELFDVQQSIAFRATSQAEAKKIETQIKIHFSEFKTSSPYERGLISYSVRTSTEWFVYSVYDDVLTYLKPLGFSSTIKEAMSWPSSY